jgi:hypothetical protein
MSAGKNMKILVVNLQGLSSARNMQFEDVFCFITKSGDRQPSQSRGGTTFQGWVRYIEAFTDTCSIQPLSDHPYNRRFPVSDCLDWQRTVEFCVRTPSYKGRNPVSDYGELETEHSRLKGYILYTVMTHNHRGIEVRTGGCPKIE